MGELVQWSDILSALFTLGHKMTVTSEYEELTELLIFSFHFIVSRLQILITIIVLIVRCGGCGYDDNGGDSYEMW